MQALGDLFAALKEVGRSMKKTIQERREAREEAKEAERREILKRQTVSAFGRAEVRGEDAALVSSGLRAIKLPFYGHLGATGLRPEDELANLNARLAAIESLFAPHEFENWPVELHGVRMYDDPPGPYLVPADGGSRLVLARTPEPWDSPNYRLRALQAEREEPEEEVADDTAKKKLDGLAAELGLRDAKD